MKLARPEVFHPRVVFAGCAAMPEGDGDDEGLVTALRHRGLHVHLHPWDDPVTLRADLVILRAARDYADRADEFLDWTRRVRLLLNPPELVAWNIDKRYLLDLACDGVPVVETGYYRPGEPAVIPAGEVMVTPAVGAGALRFTDPEAAAAHAATLQAQGRAVLVQPYDRRAEAAATVLVFLNGAPSHAFAAGARGGVDPAEAIWELGVRAVASVTRRFGLSGTDLLYARVEVIGAEQKLRLRELDLIEPSLGLRRIPEQQKARAERDFALGVESALERFGLGPLSHRGP